ncbi:MAG TPA: prolipoprotein diacylglyceryl transferase [Anaerolineae bacterium]|nr:prolipoprotein diacylglyceryl transferase [Anaerolineae bacterium]
MLDFLQIDPIAVTLPIGDGFPIYWYGIIITVGIALGAWWAGREIDRRGHDVDELYNALLIVVLVGFICARLWYVLQDMLANNVDYTLFEAINLRAGGANILGGFIGASIVAYLYILWRRLPFWDYADVAGPALLIAQGIGRWGNFINQELYGPPTDLPWGIKIAGQAPDVRFHPTFLYESLWLLIGFFLLVFLNNRYRDTWRSGTLFGLFMIWWGGGRTWIEFFRPDQPNIGESALTYSMMLALIFALVGVGILLYRYDRLPLNNRRRRVTKPKPKRES